jgi:hypothetical protein
MLGFYRVVAKPRAYLLRPVGPVEREKACCRWCKFRCDLQEYWLVRDERANQR